MKDAFARRGAQGVLLGVGVVLIAVWTVFPFFWTLWASLMGLLTTRTLPPIAILIPYFALFSAVGLVGTYYGLILTYLTSTIPLLSWILMGYFATLPIEVERAARMDGCSRLRVLRRVILPMAAPGIAAAFIIAFLFCWNELLFGIILTGGTPAQTLSPAQIGRAHV